METGDHQHQPDTSRDNIGQSDSQAVRGQRGHNVLFLVNIIRTCVMIDIGNMMSLKLSSIIILITIVQTISTLSLTVIEVPKYAKVCLKFLQPETHNRCEFVKMIHFFLQVGDSLRMVCNFSLGTDQLYSVKWYKDNMEFYR